jgi:hypothetical protein
MSEELRKSRLEQDKPNCESGKVPNSTEKYFIQGHSCTVIPYILFLLVQRGKMSPNHKCETSGGDASGVEVILYILVYVDISSKYTRGKEHLVKVDANKQSWALPPAPTPLDLKGTTPSFKDRPRTTPTCYSYSARPGALDMEETARMRASRGLNDQEDTAVEGDSRGYKATGLRFLSRVCTLN